MVMFPIYFKEVYLNNIMKAKLYLMCPFSLHSCSLSSFSAIVVACLTLSSKKKQKQVFSKVSLIPLNR